MQYLITLKNDLIQSFDDLTPDKVSLFIVNGEMSHANNDVNYIARFLLIDCRLPKPFILLAFIRQWFAHHNMTVPDIHFNSEIIDNETYDFEIDISLTDSLIISDDGTTTNLCYEPVWSDAVGGYIKGNIAVDVGTNCE